MSNYKIVAIWLAFGLGLGVLGGIQLFIASDYEILPALALIGFGLLIGLVGGAIRVLFRRQ